MMNSCSEDEAALAIRTSPALWLETCGKIEDKEKQLIRPTLNVFQRRMSAVYEHCMATGRAHRQVCLKPRRVGGTTMGAAITYHHMRNYPCNGIMIADTFGKSDKLYGIYQKFAQTDAFDWKAVVSGGVKTLQLGDSVLEKLSAEAPKGSRGMTLQALHKSESAFWPSSGSKSADETNAALDIALAPHSKTSGIEETTPKGASGAFYNHWQHARWPEFEDYWRRWGNQPDERDFPDNGILRVFAAWFEFSEYALPIASQREADDQLATLTPREKRGIRLYQWTPEQIKWRRWAIRSLCLGDERRFDEEFAEDPQTCFLSSGSPRFDSEGMTVLEVRSRSVPVEHGVLQEIDGRVSFVRTGESEAWVQVWEHPRVGCRYSLPVDPIEHIEGEGGGADKDCTAALVLRADYLDGEQRRWPPRLAARIKPPWRGDNSVTARMIMLMSKYYGGCIVVPEVNVGVGLVDKLKGMEVNLYIEERLDLITEKWTRKVGWRTTGENRDVPIDALGDAIRDFRLDVGCPHVVAELRTFVRNSKGRAEAASGRHDDDVMCLGIGLYTLGQATLLTEKPRVRPNLKSDNWVRI